MPALRCRRSTFDLGALLDRHLDPLADRRYIGGSLIRSAFVEVMLTGAHDAHGCPCEVSAAWALDAHVPTELTEIARASNNDETRLTSVASSRAHRTKRLARVPNDSTGPELACEAAGAFLLGQLQVAGVDFVMHAALSRVARTVQRRVQ